MLELCENISSEVSERKDIFLQEARSTMKRGNSGYCGFGAKKDIHMHDGPKFCRQWESSGINLVFIDGRCDTNVFD